MRIFSIKRVVILLALTSQVTACFSFNQTWQNKKEAALVLAGADAKCKPEYEERIWYALFGAIPINSLDEDAFFKKPGAAYRLSDGMQTTDLLITILGGWLVSITSRTYSVEVCDSGYVLQSPEARQAEIDREIQKYSQNSNEPLIVYIVDGNTYSGKLKEIDGEYWHLETLVKDEKPAEEKEKPDVLELKNGQVLTGKVLAQSRHSIRFRTKAGTRRYLKSAVNRLRYKVDMNEEVKKVIKIQRSQIKRVIFKG